MAQAIVPAGVIAQAPTLPLPEKGPVMDPYMNQFIRILNGYFRTLNQPNPILYADRYITTYTDATVSIGPLQGTILLDASNNSIVASLPDAATVRGTPFTIKLLSSGANTATIQAVSGNVEGGASWVISVQYEVVTFKSDGTDYWIVGGHYGP